MQPKSLLVVSFSFKFLLFYSHFAFHFIACNFFLTFRGRVAPSQLIVNLINYRNEDKQRCNMLLLMLVVSYYLYLVGLQTQSLCSNVVLCIVQVFLLSLYAVTVLLIKPCFQ